MFAPVGIEYVEQPVPASDLEALGQLRAAGIVPIAADESCCPTPRALRIVRERLADVLVLKPSLYGAWGEIAGLAVEARDAGLKLVVTSAIESTVGRRAAEDLGALLVEPGTACGLLTGAWFEDRPTAREQNVVGGMLHLPGDAGFGWIPQH